MYSELVECIPVRAYGSETHNLIARQYQVTWPSLSPFILHMGTPAPSEWVSINSIFIETAAHVLTTFLQSIAALTHC